MVLRATLRLVVLIAVLLLAIAAHAETPLPARAERSVYDEAGVVTADDERALEALHRELFEKTGVAIVIVTVPALVDETIDQLALRIGEAWGVGKKGEDRGLVVAFARDDRKVFVATGYGTEGYLPDGRVGAIIDREALPRFRAGNFSEGLARLSAALAEASAREYDVTLSADRVGAAPPAPAEPRPRWVGVARAIFTWGGLLLVLYLLVRHPGMFAMLLMGGLGRHRGGSGFRGGGGFGGFGGGGFGGGGAGRSF
jgi:uncharacterized protein